MFYFQYRPHVLSVSRRNVAGCCPESLSLKLKFLIIKAGRFGRLSARPRHPDYFSRWIVRSTVLLPSTAFASARLEHAASRSLSSYRLPRPLRHARRPLFHSFLSLSRRADALFLLLPSRRRRPAVSTLAAHRTSPPPGTAARCRAGYRPSARRRPHPSSSSNTTTTTPRPPRDAPQQVGRRRI